MELTTEDRERIEQKAFATFGSGILTYPAFIKGAEYATIYEREQQAEQAQDKIDSDHIQIKQLEAERSELKELLWICQDFLPQGVGDESDYYDRIRVRIKNSLKTK